MTACRTRHLPMMVFPEAKWCFPDQISAVQTAELDQTLNKHQSGNKRTFKVVISKISVDLFGDTDGDNRENIGGRNELNLCADWRYYKL